MKKVYLITVPSERQGEKPDMFIVDDLSLVTGKYPFFMIQMVEYVTE